MSPSTARDKRTNCYVHGLKKRIHASIQHNIALQAENERLRAWLADDENVMVERRNRIVATLESSWPARFEATLAEVMAIPDDRIDAVIDAAIAASRTSLQVEDRSL